MEVAPQKVIVAVHGIGDQTRYATPQQVLAQLCRYHGVAPAVPLGNFHNPQGMLILTADYPEELRKLAFTEVYWAGIPREVAGDGHELEGTRPWVRTLVGRVRQRKQAAPENLTERDFQMIEQVLKEMLQSIGVLDRLFALTDRMGIFSFDLNKVLVDFLGDVQIVTEFKDRCRKIIEVFDRQLEAVHRLYPEAEIYLVAHSEGTVVTLLGLLHAICGTDDKGWIRKVRGVMTIGSPIDKHLILWPELFRDLPQPCRSPERPIVWHNYYDYGDPVGFELDTARRRYTEGPWKEVFDFGADQDHGFARYPLPGKAHNDYWQDPEVFGHFIRKVIYREEGLKPQPDSSSYAEPPANRRMAQVISWVGPYLATAALLFCAVFVLYKAVHGYLDPKDVEQEKPFEVFGTVGSIACLLAGLTVMVRLPRLTRRWSWRLFGIGFFLACAAAYRVLPCLPELAGFDAFRACAAERLVVNSGPGLGIVGISIVLAITSFLLSLLFPAWGMRALLIPGSLFLTLAIYSHLKDAPEHGDLWPIFLAGAFFLYLWWLVALLFDLVFFWHQYIRGSRRRSLLRS